MFVHNGNAQLVGDLPTISVRIVSQNERERRHLASERVNVSAPDARHEEGMPILDAVVNACRIRLRPILMTSLATVLGLTPMALKLGIGSEAYAPLARAIIGGLIVSVMLTVFIVPAAYPLVYRRRPAIARGEAH